MDIGGCQVVQTLVVAVMIVVVDELNILFRCSLGSVIQGPTGARRLACRFATLRRWDVIGFLRPPMPGVECVQPLRLVHRCRAPDNTFPRPDGGGDGAASG